MNKKIFLIGILLMMCFSLAVSCGGDSDGDSDEADFYVDAAYGSDANDGSSWDKAKATITAAIDAADVDDIIYVAAGTYPDGIVIWKGLTLMGGYPPGGGTRNPETNWTIIEGIVTAPAVHIPGPLLGTSPVTIDGFHITRGLNGVEISTDNNINIMDCHIRDNLETGLKDVARPVYKITLDTVSFHGNGGKAVDLESTNVSASTFTANDCVIHNSGKGLTVTNCNLVFNSNRLMDNIGQFLFRGCNGEILYNNVYSNEQGITLDTCDVSVRLNDFSYNAFGLDVKGGKVEVDQNSIFMNDTGIHHAGNGYIHNCFVSDNKNDGIIVESDVPVINNSIDGNGVSTGGAAIKIMAVNAVNLLLVNNIISNNHYGVYESDSMSDAAPRFNNFFMNTVHYYDEGTTGYVTVTDINNSVGGAASNIEVSPGYTSNSDYHLLSTSLCIDMGDNSSAPPVDIDGDTRPYNGIVDIGADEHVP